MNPYTMSDPRFARVVANIRRNLMNTSRREHELLVANLKFMAEESRRERERAEELLLPIPTINDLNRHEDGTDEEHPDDEPDPDDADGTRSDGRAVKTLKRVPSDTPPTNEAYYSGGKLAQFVLSSERKPATVRNSRARSVHRGDDPLPLTSEE